MKDSEALEILKEKYMDAEFYFAEKDRYPKGFDSEFQEAIATVIKALSEYQEYRTLGTVEEIRSKMEELARWHSDRLNNRIKNEFAAMSTLVCHNCDHKDEYIEELEYEIEEYRAIGTVDECRAAVEKQKEKKPIPEGGRFINYYRCPQCNEYVHFKDRFCDDCGQKLNWSDSL